MADFVICPRCGRQNPADAIFCSRCGVRLLNAGVTYRGRDGSSSVGTAQLLLGLGVLVLAGLVLGGGAIFLLGSPRATPTHVAVGPTPSDQASLSTATPSAGPTPTLFTLPPTPTLLATATPTLAPTPTPSPTPSPTPVPTPAPTPVDCAVASQGTNVKQWQLGLGHDAQKGPLPKTWCVRHVTIGQWSGWGTVSLMNKNQVVFQATCLPPGAPGPCADSAQDFVPPYQANRGKTLSYKFQCFDDGAGSCADLSVVGAVITIDYEAFVGP